MLDIIWGMTNANNEIVQRLPQNDKNYINLPLFVSMFLYITRLWKLYYWKYKKTNYNKTLIKYVNLPSWFQIGEHTIEWNWRCWHKFLSAWVNSVPISTISL